MLTVARRQPMSQAGLDRPAASMGRATSSPQPQNILRSQVGGRPASMRIVVGEPGTKAVAASSARGRLPPPQGKMAPRFGPPNWGWPRRAPFAARARWPWPARFRASAKLWSDCATARCAASVLEPAPRPVWRLAILRAANVRNKLLAKVKTVGAKRHGECGRGQALGAV